VRLPFPLGKGPGVRSVTEEVYSPIVQEHLRSPQNEGPLANPDGVGVQGNPICGDTMKLMLRVRDGRVTEARWQTVGCPPARAASSLATVMARGRSLDEVAAISKEEILAALGGLPARKLHAAALAAESLHRAVAVARMHEPPSESASA
jgi:nitrogen fixation NifU-like protein